MSCVEMSYCHSPINPSNGKVIIHNMVWGRTGEYKYERGAPEWMGGGCEIRVLRVLDGTIQNY
jgi:hypothetical protein